MRLPPDQYDVIIADPTLVVPLGTHVPLQGTVIIAGIDTNVGRPRIGIKRTIAGGASGSGLSLYRSNTSIVLSHPNGIYLDEWGLTGGQVGDGVTVIHGGSG